MSLTREDMLRELELLPVWRPRMPPVTNVQLEVSELSAVLTVAEVTVGKTEHVLTESVLADVDIAEPLPDEQEEILLAEVVETATVEVVAEPLIQSPWLLLCPQISDDASQQLMQNILRALQLRSEDVLLHPQSSQIAQVQSRFCVLFGLEAANHFLGTQHTDISLVRGQLLTQGDMAYVITHHPHAMLAQPLLKKEVWHDLCLLLAKK
jgi:uracil-DNA glycosylase